MIAILIRFEIVLLRFLLTEHSMDSRRMRDCSHWGSWEELARGDDQLLSCSRREECVL